MRKFHADDLQAFLVAVDAALKRPAEITIIGGSALALAYDVEIGTKDIDTFESDLAPLRRAVERAQEATGLKIPLDRAAVADIPYNADDRRVRILPELEKLRVYVLERHDLALSKTVRGYQNDVDAIAALHETHPLDLGVLVERWRAEMSHAMGAPDRLRQNFEVLVDVLFGEIEAARVRDLLGSPRKRKRRK